METEKLTRLEKYWILYDVGNSAFTLLVATIIPIYFNYLAGEAGISEVDYLAYWGYAASAATLMVAVLGPVLERWQIRRISRNRFFSGASWWELPACACGRARYLAVVFGDLSDREGGIFMQPCVL